MHTKQWPSCFPNNCPPESCVFDTIQVYRLTNSETPTLSDFQMSLDDTPSLKYKIDQNMGLMYYRLYSLSMFSDILDLKNAMKSSGNMKSLAKRKPCVCFGDTRDGAFLITPGFCKCHLSLWLYDGATPHNYFQFIEKV